MFLKIGAGFVVIPLETHKTIVCTNSVQVNRRISCLTGRAESGLNILVLLCVSGAKPSEVAGDELGVEAVE